MQINLERGGIIWQARSHMATAPYVEPLNEDAGEFLTFASDMARTRVPNTQPTDTMDEFYKLFMGDTKLSSIGRVARVEKDLPSGKRLSINLALLDESVGIMPPYRPETPDVRKIGRANFFLRNADEHTHLKPSKPRYESVLSAGFDILTDGRVNATFVSLEACKDCITVQLHDDSKIVHKLGLQALFHSSARQIPTVSSYFGPYVERTSRIVQQMLTTEQVSGLQSFLAEHFQSTE